MSIEQDAQKDLSPSDEEAEAIVGGKKSKHTAPTQAAGRTVPYIKVPGFTGTPDSTLPESDCAPDDTASV